MGTEVHPLLGKTPCNPTVRALVHVTTFNAQGKQRRASHRVLSDVQRGGVSTRGGHEVTRPATILGPFHDVSRPVFQEGFSPGQHLRVQISKGAERAFKSFDPEPTVQTRVTEGLTGHLH